MYYSLLIILIAMLQADSFKATQLKKERVKGAYIDKESIVRKYFEVKGLDFNGFHIFIRAFKHEEILEVWVKHKESSSYTLLQNYAFCASSGTLGPKRKEGDLQIPEGVYHINHFNPESNFHLSLGISYPNQSDKILGHPSTPGSAIYIHGNCVTVGCIPLTDDKIKELYLLAVEARNNGQQKIPVHIFPMRMEEEKMKSMSERFSSTQAFWQNLKPIYDSFEQTRRLNEVKVTATGQYKLSENPF